MPTFLENRQTAVAWMFERRDQVDWWQWRVLTACNSDASGPRLSQKDAVAIFADLTYRGLLVPTYDNNGALASAINPTKEAEWKAIISPGLTALWAGLGWVWQNIISGIVGAIIGAAVTAMFGVG